MIRKSSASRSDKSRTSAPRVNSDSDVVLKRLERIAQNYELLDELLDDLESRLPSEPTDPNASKRPAKPR